MLYGFKKTGKKIDEAIYYIIFYIILLDMVMPYHAAGTGLKKIEV